MLGLDAKAKLPRERATEEANMAKAAKKAAPKAAPKAEPKKVVASDNDTPETKRSTKAQQDAAEALFTGADGAVRNEEQHENHIRRQALGF